MRKQENFFRRYTWFRTLFDRFQWYRRLAGGKWELWYVDCPGIHGEYWHDVQEFTRVRKARLPSADEIMKREMEAYRRGDVTVDWGFHPAYWGYRPTPFCRGTPIEEDWS